MHAFQGMNEFKEDEDEADHQPFDAKKGGARTLEEIKDQLSVAEQNFNRDQKHSDRWKKWPKNAERMANPTKVFPSLLSGPGGTGKSYVASACRNCIHLEFAESLEDLIVSVVAPTGTAAVNIDGDT